MASSKTIVLITGANGGVGYDTAAAVAALPDHHVIMSGRSESKVQAAVSKLQSKQAQASLSWVILDVTDEASITAAAAQVEKEFGRVDVLVNNAGIVSMATPLAAQLREVFETNTFGPYLVTEAFVPLLKKSSSPRLVYVSSDLGSIGLRSDPSYKYYKLPATTYRMAKAALNMLTACHAFELNADNIKVFAFNPGYVVTNLTGEADREARVKQGAKSSELSAADLCKIIQGQRDAEAGKFLHGEAGSFTTGDGVHPW